jgi:hypothetical protein
MDDPLGEYPDLVVQDCEHGQREPLRASRHRRRPGLNAATNHDRKICAFDKPRRAAVGIDAALVRERDARDA